MRKSRDSSGRDSHITSDTPDNSGRRSERDSGAAYFVEHDPNLWKETQEDAYDEIMGMMSPSTQQGIKDYLRQEDLDPSKMDREVKTRRKTLQTMQGLRDSLWPKSQPSSKRSSGRSSGRDSQGSQNTYSERSSFGHG